MVSTTPVNSCSATGSYAKTLPGLEIDGFRSSVATKMDYVPKASLFWWRGHRMRIASLWKSFGAQVTIIEDYAFNCT